MIVSVPLIQRKKLQDQLFSFYKSACAVKTSNYDEMANISNSSELFEVAQVWESKAEKIVMGSLSYSYIHRLYIREKGDDDRLYIKLVSHFIFTCSGNCM